MDLQWIGLIEGSTRTIDSRQQASGGQASDGRRGRERAGLERAGLERARAGADQRRGSCD